VQTLAETGTPVILHSCGNIKAVLPELVDTGISGLNNLQRTAHMNIEAVKATYGPKLCLIGNVDATTLMPTATPAEVEQAVQDCLQIGAPGGGYVLATDHSFHEGIPLENVYAFIKAGHNYGKY
jgi:uroporphyrinogen decarboxylase